MKSTPKRSPLCPSPHRGSRHQSLGDLQPGETKSVKGRIVLIPGNVEEANKLLSFE